MTMEETHNPNAPVMPSNSKIRSDARHALSGNWAQPVLTTLVYSLIESAASSLLLVGLLILCPLEFGFKHTFLRFMRGERKDEMVGDQFKVFNEYSRYLGGSLLVALYTFLWCLLLIVPGIIKSYSYAMTPYIMLDNPNMDSEDCIHRSREMMHGYKWKLFCLDLSFIGWAILCLFTLGIGFFWLQPYIECSRAQFYEELKALHGNQSQETAQ